VFCLTWEFDFTHINQHTKLKSRAVSRIFLLEGEGASPRKTKLKSRAVSRIFLLGGGRMRVPPPENFEKLHVDALRGFPQSQKLKDIPTNLAAPQRD
jgi:hypothetical protein